MQRNDLWKYIQIGTNLRYLQDASDNYPISKENGVIDNISRLFKEMDELELTHQLARTCCPGQNPMILESSNSHKYYN